MTDAATNPDRLAGPFLVPEGGPYLATHSVGCLTRAARDALQSTYVEPRRRAGADAWETWLAGLDDFRAALARLLGGHATDYCPQPNLSAALAAVLGAMPADRRRNVWIAAEESFPSLGFVLRRAEALGWRLRLIPRTRSPGELESWTDAFTPDVAGVLVTHVFSNSGVVAPVVEIARAARDAGVFSVVDVAQSAGIIPSDVEALVADAVIGSCVKWLCGGPGAGFLWMREATAGRLHPADIGWFSHENPFEMDIHSFREAAGVRRFWGGTPSVAPYVMAAASMNVLAGLGIDRVLAHTRELQRLFRESVAERWRSKVPATGIGGTLCIPCGDDLDDIRRGLAALGARHDVRGDVVRLSFHLCNTTDQARAVAGVFA